MAVSAIEYIILAKLIKTLVLRVLYSAPSYLVANKTFLLLVVSSLVIVYTIKG